MNSSDTDRVREKVALNSNLVKTPNLREEIESAFLRMLFEEVQRPSLEDADGLNKTAAVDTDNVTHSPS